MEPSHRIDSSSDLPVDHDLGCDSLLPRARIPDDSSAEAPLEFGVASVPSFAPSPPETVQGDGLPLEAAPVEAAADEPELPSVWNRRSVLLIVLAVVIAIGAAGLGTFFVFYDRATSPDRSSPSVVVRKYIDAMYNERDSSSASQYACDDPQDVGQSQELLDYILEKESAYQVSISVAIGGFQTITEGDSSTVTVRLRLTTNVDGQSQEQIQNWTFTLQDESGWLVCDAQQIG